MDMRGCGWTLAAELSEAIHTMCQWYEDSRVCYAYLRDIWGAPFPTASDDQRCSNFKWLAGVVLGWVDSTRDDRTKGCPVLQQGLAAHS